MVVVLVVVVVVLAGELGRGVLWSGGVAVGFGVAAGVMALSMSFVLLVIQHWDSCKEGQS